MNILVVCEYGLYKDLSFSFVHNQIREYKALGHKVRVIIPNGFGKIGRNGGRFEKTLIVSEADGVEMYDLRYLTLSEYGKNGFNTWSAITAIRMHWGSVFRDFRPDVIHAHTLGFDSEIGAWLKTKHECPLIVTTHGSDTFIPYSNGQMAQLKMYAEKADAVVCVSSLLRRRLEECGVQTPMPVILNGFVVSGDRTACKKIPYSVIQVGNLIPRKKTDVTIGAVAELRSKGYPVTLTVVGDGPERDKLQALCRELNMESCVEFLGQLPNQEAQRLMARAEYFVMPSVREGFGIVYVEAMAAECVVIGTEGEGIADVIVNGENGFLVPADDPASIAGVIEGGIRNPSATEQIAKSGSVLAAQMTWNQNAAQYERLFRTCAGKEDIFGN